MTVSKKTIRNILFTSLTALFLVTGCRNSIQSKPDTAAENTLKICKLEVYSASANPSQIYHASYPYYYYTFTKDTGKKGKTISMDLDQHLPVSDIPKEDVQYFIDYISSLPESSSDGTDISYSIRCRYKDSNGNEESIYRRGYDSFPDDWDVFIDKYNEILGDDILSGGNTLKTVTPEFLTEVFGVTDDDVREGSLQDVIDVQNLDIIKITSLFYMDDALNGYYSCLKESEISPYRPAELISIDSTTEEYDEFLLEYLNKIGCDFSIEEKSDQEYLRYFSDPDSDISFYTARTCDMSNLPTGKGETDDYYRLYLDAHMEDMTFSMDFIYSADKKFILVPYKNDPDIILPFCE